MGDVGVVDDRDRAALVASERDLALDPAAVDLALQILDEGGARLPVALGGREGLFPFSETLLEGLYSLAGIGEGLLREYFINESRTLRAAKLSVEQFTELLTTMYYRALFLENPDANELEYTRNLSAMVRAH